MKSKETTFEKDIAQVEARYRKMQEPLEAMRQKLKAGDIRGAYQDALNLADASEKLTMIARQLPVYTGNPHAYKSVEQIMAKNTGIRVGFTDEGWFGAVIPALLPKKGKSGSVDYLRDNMYQAMGKFFRGKQPVRYTDCVIVFRHIYKRDRPERQYRDHDNIEINTVVDAIAFYVLMDDAPLRCFHYYCSAPGDENATEVFVVPQSEIAAWILNAKSYDGSGVALHENLP